ncbi:MAG: squalene--hopene cyclase [Acidimicrobiales bacterium]
MTVREATSAGFAQRVRDTVINGSLALTKMRDADGYWKGELETNVTMDAEDLLLREFLGVRDEEVTAASARWIRSKQREDGTWANFFGGPPELSTTVEAYVALRLAGDEPSAPHMERASRYVRSQGGLEATRAFTRIWLALFGLWEWGELPVIPVEMVLLPRWFPLNIYDFACWARQTVVALSIVSAYRPAHPIDISIDELKSGVPRPLQPSLSSWRGRFAALDRLLHRYERRPIAWLRRMAMVKAERWIVAHQENDGCWGGIQPPWVYSLIALSLRGYSLEHPVIEAGIKGIDSFTVTDSFSRRLEACQSPVWDTALAMIALADAGAPPDEDALSSSAAWLVEEEVSKRGDWSIRRENLEPGGWAFEFENDWYPDIDDTAEVVLALLRSDRADHPSVSRGVDWVLGMQCADGGWAAFDADNTRALCRELPFCDFGELIDPPSADVTAHVLEMLAALGHRSQATERGVRWLLNAQEEDGSWFGRWGANYVYGTGAAIVALVASGLGREDPAITRAVAWLARHQNPDGGFGEDLRSYEDPAWRGRGTSTPSQTAWALQGLEAAGEREVSKAAAGFLVESQMPDGTWEEPLFTGTGFPGAFYINYHLYRQVFPVSALGRYLRTQGDDG